MNPALLVLHRHAQRFRAALEQEFPELPVLCAQTLDQALPLAPRSTAIVALDSQFHDQLIGAAPALTWVHALTSGCDVLSGLRALDRSAVVATTTRGIHGPQMSELALLHMLALTRRFAVMLDNQRAARWERWEQPLLWRKTAVIFGIGAIAQDMARRFDALGMTVLGISRIERALAPFERIYPRSLAREAVSKADYLVVLAPHTPENHHVVDAQLIAAMKPGAFLINLSRGGVVDEQALVAALTRRAIAGAGLDVFAAEPLPPEHALWALDNVILTPRIGGMSDVYVEQCLPQLRHNLRAWLRGEPSAMRNRVVWPS